MSRSRTRILAGAVALSLAGAAWITLLAPSESSHAAVPTGTTVRTSLQDPSIADGNDESPDGGGDSMISGNGRFDIYTSDSNDAPGPGTGTHLDNAGAPDANVGVYVRDLKAGTTNLVSFGRQAAVPPDPPFPGTPAAIVPANSGSRYPSITNDGRYISFLTTATNIVSATPNGSPTALVVCDRGAPNATTGQYRQAPASGAYPSFFTCVAAARIAYPMGGANQVGEPNGKDSNPHLAADANANGATPLRIAWTEFNDAKLDQSSAKYVDIPRVLGAIQTPTPQSQVQLSRTEREIGAQDTVLDYTQPEISANGRWMVVAATDFDDGEHGIIEADLSSTDSNSGSPRMRRVDLRTKAPNTFWGTDNTVVGHPSVSADGTQVVYDYANDPTTNQFQNSPAAFAVTVHTDRFLDQPAFPSNFPTSAAEVSRLVSALADGSVSGGNGDGAFPTISRDGRFVAFVTDRPGMWVGSTGPRSGTSCLTPSDDGGSGSTDSGSASASASPSPSGSSSGPTPNSRTVCQVVARDLTIDAQRLAANPPKPMLAAELASPSLKNTCTPASSDGVCPGDFASTEPLSMSRNGGRVGYDSFADDLAPNDSHQSDGNGFFYIDAFVRTWTPQVNGTTLNFGTVPLGSSSQKSFTITVIGFGPVPVGQVSVSGAAAGDFTLDATGCTNTTVYDGTPCSVTVTFSPSASGTRNATISVFPPTNGAVFPPDNPAQPILTRPVTGVGGPKSTTPTTPPPTPVGPHLVVDPTTLNFGSAVPLKPGGTKKTTTVQNTGDQNLNINSIGVIDSTVPGATGDYTITGCGAPLGTTVPPGGSCVVTVTWVGHAIGSRNAVLVIKSTGPSDTRNISLLANVPKPKITVNPGVLPAGRVTSVSGTGFAPKHNVDVKVPFAVETIVKTDAKGAFTTGLLVLKDATAGPRTVVATMPGLSPTITAKAPLLIVLGSIQGPILVTRH